jgi:hypothetical protein
MGTVTCLRMRRAPVGKPFDARFPLAIHEEDDQETSVPARAKTLR